MLKYIFANIKFLLYAIFALFLLLFFFFVGINLWFFILIILWLLFYFVVIRKQFIVIKLTEYIISVSFIVLIVISIILLVIGISTKPTTTNNSSMGVKLTKEQCAPLYQEYDGKVLKLMGEGLIGSLSIKINPEDCKFEGRYLFLVNTSLPANYDTKNSMPYPYNYIGTITAVGETKRISSDSVGVMSAVYRNQGVLADAFGDSVAISEFYRIANDPGTNLTDWFYNSHTTSRYFSLEQYERLLKPEVFNIVDGLPFIEVEQLDGGGVSTGINHDRAAVEGNIVKSIPFSVSE